MRAGEYASALYSLATLGVTPDAELLSQVESFLTSPTSSARVLEDASPSWQARRGVGAAGGAAGASMSSLSSMGSMASVASMASIDDDALAAVMGGSGDEAAAPAAAAPAKPAAPAASITPLETAKVYDLTKLVNALALFSHQPSPLFLRSLDRRLGAQLSYMSPGDVSSLLYAYACMGARPEERLLERLTGHAQSKFGRFTGDELAQLTVALATFQYAPRGPWMDGFLIEVRAKVATCTAEGLERLERYLPSFGGGGGRQTEILADVVAQMAVVAAAAPPAEEAPLAEEAAEQEPAMA